MNAVLKNIIDTIDVEKIEANLFRGQCHPSEHVFGGQVLAQAITSAYRTVKKEHKLHSLHSYFLRPGDSSRPILFEVDPIRDGKSFSTRRVAAIQKGKTIFTLSCSWQKEEIGLIHSQPIPDVLPPEALRGDLEVFKTASTDEEDINRFTFRFEAIDSRSVEKTSMVDGETHPPYKNTWLKVREQLTDEPWIHLGLLAYMSDLDFMSTSILPHGREKLRGGIQGASLDHSIWFHRPFRADQWLLFVKESPHAGGGRGFIRGKFFNRTGELVATAAQECLIRPVASTSQSR